jgi:DNA-binding GntR family transcriptional regulator
MLKHKTLGEETYNQLKQLILTGKYAPGQRLIYEQLSRELGVSQTPLKEAFLRLEKEGLVVIIARRGTFVREFTREDIREFYEVREMLEALSARLASRTATEADVEGLRKICDRFEAGVARQDVTQCLKADIRFHEEIVRISGNKRLLEIVHAFVLTNLFSIVGRGNKYLEKGTEIMRQHAMIVDAIEKHDPDLAEQVMREQISQGGGWILEDRVENDTGT